MGLVRTRQDARGSLSGNFAVLMGNHGLTFCGTSIPHGTCMGVFIEKAAKANVVGRSAGFKYTMPSPAIRARRNSQIMSDVHVEHSWNFFNRKLDWFLERERTQVIFR